MFCCLPPLSSFWTTLTSLSRLCSTRPPCTPILNSVCPISSRFNRAQRPSGSQKNMQPRTYDNAQKGKLGAQSWFFRGVLKEGRIVNGAGVNGGGFPSLPPYHLHQHFRHNLPYLWRQAVSPGQDLFNGFFGQFATWARKDPVLPAAFLLSLAPSAPSPHHPSCTIIPPFTPSKTL